MLVDVVRRWMEPVLLVDVSHIHLQNCQRARILSLRRNVSQIAMASGAIGMQSRRGAE